MTDYPADSILVLLEASPTGELAKSAAGLLGAAALIGTPVALAVTAPGQAQALAEQAAAAGAERVLVVESDAGHTQLTVPYVDALAAAAEAVAPDAVLISNSIEGRDIAGRFAARTGAPIAVDAVGVSRDAEGVVARHSVYGGAYNVDSAATFGPLVDHRSPGRDRRTRRGPARRPRDARRAALGRGVGDHRVGRGRRSGLEPSRASRRDAGRVGRPRPRFGREVRARRRAGRRARRRHRRVARRRRRRLHPGEPPGRPDRRLGVAAAVRRPRHLGGDPAPRRHADGQEHRRR